jgi:hypothetical protein
MSRTGVEAKPAWRSMPSELRDGVAGILGARVARAQRVYGGYSPTPTFRVRLSDGRRAFVKAAGPGSTAFARSAHEREERVYRELGHLLGRWAPRHLGAWHDAEWRVLVLEDLGPKSAPPWTRSSLRTTARELGRFHASTAGRSLPDWIDGPGAHGAMGVDPPAWAFDAASLDRLAALAGDRASEASAWLRSAVPALATAAGRIADPSLRHALLHVDVRSDNLRLDHGRLVLFDWPHVGVGPPEFDAVAFAQTIPIERGPSDPETVMRWYAETWDVNPDAVDAAVASIAGYFADHAWAAGIPGLPRVRGFQRQQFRVSLRWAARRLGLPDPAWVDRVARVSAPAQSFR